MTGGGFSMARGCLAGAALSVPLWAVLIAALFLTGVL